MVIDPSALLAILQDEPERRAFNEAIEAATDRRLATGSFVELSIVMEARVGAEGIRNLDLFLATAGIELVAFDVDQARIAREALRRFGKGQHPAGLNLGDCFSYALARAKDEPLLFKRNDFTQTDLTPACTTHGPGPVEPNNALAPASQDTAESPERRGRQRPVPDASRPRMRPPLEWLTLRQVGNPWARQVVPVGGLTE